MSSFIRTKLKTDTVNEIASKILALSPEIILPTFIQSINKHLLSINLTNYLCYVLNSTNTSHDGPQYSIAIQNPHWPPQNWQSHYTVS